MVISKQAKTCKNTGKVIMSTLRLHLDPEERKKIDVKKRRSALKYLTRFLRFFSQTHFLDPAFF